MATNYGYGIVSNHGKLTFNGVDYRKLDANTLYAVGRYMNTLNSNQFSDKKKGWFGSSIMAGRKNSPRDNWYDEQFKISHQLQRLGIDPAGLSNSHGRWDTGSQVSPELDRSLTKKNRNSAITNADFASYLASRAPVVQAAQQEVPTVTAAQQITQGAAGQSSAIKRQYQQLLSGRQNNALLGI